VTGIYYHTYIKWPYCQAHLIRFAAHNVGITVCRKLKVWRWFGLQWYNVCTTFNACQISLFQNEKGVHNHRSHFISLLYFLKERTVLWMWVNPSCSFLIWSHNRALSLWL
jgi:hypothetical protein